MITKHTTENTLVDYPRLEQIVKHLKATSHLPGIIAEVGVYKGGTAYLLCDNTPKSVLLFDTFEGMPKVDPVEDIHREGDFGDTSLEEVRSLLSPFSNSILVKGLFPNDHTPTLLEGYQFSLVHLDCDIYKSVKECLEFFYPRVPTGGVIILDDYNEPDCPGAKKAANEFMSDKPESIEETVQSQAIIVKM